MIEKTYTVERVLEAMQKGKFSKQAEDQVIAELQRPAYVPAVGEVAYNINECKYDKIATLAFAENHRFSPLTRTECGPVGAALSAVVDVSVAALQAIQEAYTAVPTRNCYRPATDALAEIKRLAEDV